jgi:hypothetical protein
MPITYHIDPERNLVTISANGIINDPEYREIRARIASDPQFRPGMNQLEDYRSVEEHNFTAEGYDSFLDQEISLRPVFGESRHAIVTSSDLHFGLTRKLIVEIGDSHQDTRVFRSMEEAEAWLSEEYK